MASSLHFYAVGSPHVGVRNSLSNFSPMSSLPISSSKLYNYGKLEAHAMDHVSAYRIRKETHSWKDLTVSCVKGKKETVNQRGDVNIGHFTSVEKFGRSSVSSAERMKEVADLILSFPEERPVVVLSAMGKTTNKLLLAGLKAVSCGVSNVSKIDELSFIKELHLGACAELGIDSSIISANLEELEQLLKAIATLKQLSGRTKDHLVSFGKCMSTRIFAAYLSQIGVKARQYDAFEIGFITTDEFTNANILEATYSAVAKRLHSDWISDPAIPVVTGSLGKGLKSGAVTTLGRGGSDLTAAAIGKALGLPEVQVWKDVDGVLARGPNIYTRAKPEPYVTFEEADELAYFGSQEFGPVVEKFEKIAVVNLFQNRPFIPKFGNIQRSSLELENEFQARISNGVDIQMIYPVGSKVNISSSIINDSEAVKCDWDRSLQGKDLLELFHGHGIRSEIGFTPQNIPHLAFSPVVYCVISIEAFFFTPLRRNPIFDILVEAMRHVFGRYNLRRKKRKKYTRKRENRGSPRHKANEGHGPTRGGAKRTERPREWWKRSSSLFYWTLHFNEFGDFLVRGFVFNLLNVIRNM